MTRLDTLNRDISPPPLRKASTAPTPATENDQGTTENPSLAAIEAGQAEIRNHLDYFLQRLSAVARPTTGPRISFAQWQALWNRNQHRHGTHFVVHQHDHPISGVHYDLRLQFSATSTVSFAVPYGLPGNPNSMRPNRMAIETRVHNLWNNIIESASHATGSLLIWDTGEYEVLPRTLKQAKVTDDELSDVEMEGIDSATSHSEKLFASFQSRHIRLRLHGTRLPKNYTISLRLPSANDKSGQPKKPSRKRRRLEPAKTSKPASYLTDSETDESEVAQLEDVEAESEDVSAALASEDEEDAAIRSNNAYTGATNSIGSIHQRHWFLTLDRPSSGFRKARSDGRWEGDWETFFVRGRDHERSVVTGRTSDDCLHDEGVEKFVGRKMWRPIVE